MGMYTRLVLNVAITADHTSTVAMLQAAVQGEAELPGRLKWMFCSSSYYHDNVNHASFKYDNISHCWKLSVVCDLKNYENEIHQMLELIAPAVRTDEVAGYYLYEEDTAPTLFWFRSGKLIEHCPQLPATVVARLETE